MKRVRFLSRWLSGGMLSAMLGILGAQVAQAQRPIPLLDLTCVRRGQGGYSTSSQDVSIGRELYISTLAIQRDTALTCRLPGGPASLRLEFGIPDEASNTSPGRIEVYVDGNQVITRSFDKGQLYTILADVSNGKSLALEVSCARSSNCYFYSYYHFIKAQIEPGARSPGSR